MTVEEAIQKGLKQLTTPQGEAFIALVKSIDKDKATCEVEDSLGIIYTARLRASVNNDKGLVVYPKTGSYVVVSQIGNQANVLYVAMVGEIEAFSIKNGDAVFLVENNKFTIKNEEADLKDILMELFDQLNAAIILTPTGPGNFSPGDVQKFTELKEKTTQLCH